MPKNQPTYHEKLLHWIWENRQFDSNDLVTSDNQEIRVHRPGKLNKSDGPDFKKAEVTIGKLRWFGDIEIHWHASDWQNHGHHHDTQYNNVILHVVFAETTENVCRKDQSYIPTLCLGQYISKPLESFLNQYLNSPQLPCSKQLSFISEDAFLKQLEKAHKEYFEQKVDDLLAFYDPNLPPSSAWLKLFTLAFFDGLGISHNRESMQKLGNLLFDNIETCTSAEELRQKALELSKIHRSGASTYFNWNHKGSRPNNHPKHRIQQAALGLWYLYHLPFEQWMYESPQQLWKNFINAIAHTPAVGKGRASILFGTVFLPALYLLANLFHSESLKQKSWRLWQSHKVRLPKSLLKTLQKTDLAPSCYDKKLGTIYQLRNYCKKGQCQNCIVFKNAISS